MSKVKSSIGVLGALATIVSVWWFALRPRRNQGDAEEQTGGSDPSQPG
ncbi:MAG TPA: hypothetical protein VK704_07245 [Acidimicrobiales bacterium]|nr:hypothetical protein [Acidimicrobiales bacterium]